MTLSVAICQKVIYVCVELVTHMYYFWSFTLRVVRLLFQRTMISRIFLVSDVALRIVDKKRDNPM